MGQQGAGWAGEAKVKTVKITSALTLGFVICWIPFIVMTFWSCIDNASFVKFEVNNGFIYIILENFACVNNCLNPLFYGMFGKKWISWNKFFGKRKQDKRINTSETLETET